MVSEAGSRHGLVNVSRLAALDVVKHLTVGGVDDIQGLPRQGGHGLIGDEIQLHGQIVNRLDGLKNHDRDTVGLMAELQGARAKAR